MKKISLKQLILIFSLIGLILSIPSIVYLFFHGGNIESYNGQNYYFLDSNSMSHTVIGAIILAAIIILGFLIYILVLKKSNEFKNIKNILLVVFIVGLMFIICLPNTTTDIFYYMGTGRLFQEYGENPYYTTISDFLSNGNIIDPILEKSGYWADTIVPYGPLWTSICGLFSFISLGNLTFLLYIYKIASLGIHIATCYIVYKLTNKKKFALMYGLNPFLLLEFLTNVHNDLYLVFFVLLGIYFLKNKNNIWASLACLACSILIKYITVVLAPFLVLYYLKDKTKLKKILWCILYAAVVITVILGIYMLFFNSIRRFTFNIRNTTRKNKGLNLSNNVSFRIK